MISLSVIVPVYNEEPYLAECLGSLTLSLFPEMEVILINDGSTDRTGEICRNFAKRHPQIHLIEQKNIGAVLVRNRGLDMAQGEYIGFLDADDRLSPGFFPSMLRCAKQADCDICQCNLAQFTSSHSPVSYSDHTFLSFLDRTGGDVKHDKSNLWEPGWLPRRLFRRKILTENKIRFRTGIQILEDLLFSSEALLAAEKIAYCPDATYYYRIDAAGSQCAIADERLLSLFTLFQILAQNCPQQYLPIVAGLSVRTLLYGYSRLPVEYHELFCKRLCALPHDFTTLARQGASDFSRYYRDSRKMRLSNEIASVCFCAALAMARKKNFRSAEFILNLATELAIRGNLRQRLKEPIVFLKRLFPIHHPPPAR